MRDDPKEIPMPQDATATTSMNSPLRRHFRAIQKLLATAAVDEVQTRYKIGRIVRGIQDAEATYGARAVERLAGALGRDQATLYRYAALARVWPEPEMLALSRRRNCHGEPLSWSHWLELSTLRDWRPWLERALAEGWSVRRLKDAIETEVQERPALSTFDEDETTRAALLETIRDAERWNARVTHSLAPVLDRLARSPERSPQMNELFARSLNVFSDALRSTGAMVARMRELSPGRAKEGPAHRVDRAERGIWPTGTAQRHPGSAGLRT
jgi:hypothetical protein